MKLLGLETSGEHGSVALMLDGDIRERTIASPREQTAQLLDLIGALLAEGGATLGALDGIAFGRGPGSFTGLRVAAAVAQGLTLANGVPLLPVSSLAALAQGAARMHGIEHALIAIDARMGEIYAGEFATAADSLPSALRAEALVEPRALAPPARPGFSALGNGFAAYAAELAPLTANAARVLTGAEAAARDLLPLAAADLAAGRVARVEEALPTYLRDESAWRR